MKYELFSWMTTKLMLLYVLYKDWKNSKIIRDGSTVFPIHTVAE